jgi:hypothetical protein
MNNQNVTLLPQKSTTIIPAVSKNGYLTVQVVFTRREADGLRTYGSKEFDKYNVEGFKRALNKLQRTLGSL